MENHVLALWFRSRALSNQGAMFASPKVFDPLCGSQRKAKGVLECQTRRCLEAGNHKMKKDCLNEPKNH